jgi:hypothetical protein
MIVTKITAVVLALVYLGAWAFALNGASGLIPILATPLVLVVLVAGGNWLSSTMGISRKAPQFKKPTDHE